MTVDNGDDLKHLKSIGRIVFETMLLMKKSLKPGISTAALRAAAVAKRRNSEGAGVPNHLSQLINPVNYLRNYSGV